jgi:hypothetical protein
MTDTLRLDIEQLVPAESFDQVAEEMRRQLATDDQSGNKKWAKALSALGGSKIAVAISEQLNHYDLLVLFAQGWVKAAVFDGFKDKNKHPDGKPEFLELGSFKQELTFNPQLSLSSMGIESNPIGMTIAVKADFDAVEVTIQNAHLTEIGGGSCKIAVDFKCGDVNIFTKSTPLEFKLMNRKKLPGPGVAIL